jgi:hypothetical protein
MCRVSSDGGRQKIAKAIWQFHPTARRHVFDAVLKHGWPSANNLKPLHYRRWTLAEVPRHSPFPPFFVNRSFTNFMN